MPFLHPEPLLRFSSGPLGYKGNANAVPTVFCHLRWLARPRLRGLFVGEVLVFLLFKGKLMNHANQPPDASSRWTLRSSGYSQPRVAWRSTAPQSFRRVICKGRANQVALPSFVPAQLQNMHACMFYFARCLPQVALLRVALKKPVGRMPGPLVAMSCRSLTSAYETREINNGRCGCERRTSR